MDLNKVNIEKLPAPDVKKGLQTTSSAPCR